MARTEPVAPRKWVKGRGWISLCNHDGGQGIGAGHVCRCIREAGHPLTDHYGRPHGCSCGALWAGGANG